MTDTVNITINRNDLFSLIVATDNYRSHWFDNYLEELNPVDKIVYDRVVDLCQSIKEQVNDYTQLDA